MLKYPIYYPYLRGNEKKYVNDCLDTKWISSQGKYVSLFEEAVCNYTGVKHAISVFNGTAALELALLSIGIKAGDEILVPDFTYIASANAVTHVGAIPVLVDVAPDDWNIDCKKIEKHIGPKTKGIMTTDIYGMPANYQRIQEIAHKHNLLIIEDAAESFGAVYNKKKAGNFGDIATFSFFGNKTITTGEGGMVLTNNDQCAVMAKKIRNQGNSDTIRYYHDMLGYNFRMTNIQAAIGLAQIEQIDDILEKKRNICNWYKSSLSSLLTFQNEAARIRSSYWMVGFLCQDQKEKQQLAEYLMSRGIDSRPFFFPIHRMPFYTPQEHPVSISLSEKGLCVPSYPSLTKEDINYICEEIKKCITAYRKHTQHK